jgi:hypothetical protein
MYKIFFAAIASTVLLAACNNSAEKKEKPADTTAKSENHDMHSMPAGGDVPALPAVPEGGKVFFKNLKAGQTISLPFKIEMGAEMMKVDTANGPITAGSGHHHLLIDAEDSIAAGTVVPKDSAHVHFGKGQTEYELKGLTPGNHKLVLQMADALHRSYGGRLTATVTVQVKK